MSTVMVIGGAGFIGSNICRELLQMGDHRVVVFDNFTQYTNPFELDYSVSIHERFRDIRNQVAIVRGDATKRSTLERAMRDHKPEYVIHLAALPLSTLSDVYIDEAVESTVMSTANILDVIKDAGHLKRFVYTSSSMVYGDFQYVPADEEHPKNPKEVYGGAKYAGEIVTQSICRRFGLDYTIIRPSAVYGRTDLNKRVSGVLINNAIQGKELVLHGGASTTLDFTNVRDVAHGFVLATFSDNARNEVFNITRGEGRSLVEYAEIIRKHMPGVKVTETGADTARPKRGALDISKARRLLGYEPQFSLEEGLEDYIKFAVQQAEEASERERVAV